MVKGIGLGNYFCRRFQDGYEWCRSLCDMGRDDSLGCISAVRMAVKVCILLSRENRYGLCMVEQIQDLEWENTANTICQRHDKRMTVNEMEGTTFSLYQCIFCHSYMTLLGTANLSICQLLIEINYPRFWVFIKALMSHCLTVTVPNGCCWVTWKSMQRSISVLWQGQVLWFTLFSPCLGLQNIYVFSPRKCDACTRSVAVAEVRGWALGWPGTLPALQLARERGKAGKQGISDSHPWKLGTRPFKINDCHMFGFKAPYKTNKI